MLTEQKAGKLFTCAQVADYMETTPSIKTKLSMVEVVLARVSNPKEGSQIVDLFSYANDVS